MSSAGSMIPAGYVGGMWHIPPELVGWVALVMRRGIDAWNTDTAAGGTPAPPAELVAFVRSVEAHSEAQQIAADAGALDDAEDVWLSTENAARHVGYHPQQIRRWAAAGKVRSMRPHPRHILVSLTDVETAAALHRAGDWPDV